jgi:aminopeptidase N
MYRIRFAAFSSALVPVLAFGVLSLLPACRANRTKKEALKTIPGYDSTALEFKYVSPAYQPVVPKVLRLLHTQLQIEPNFANSTLEGKATLSLVPHFYNTDSVVLDAKCFDIKDVKINKGNKVLPCKYEYDQKKIRIRLEKEIGRKDTILCTIQYLAKPEECEKDGGSAIASDKGLFFINPDGSDPYKPVQLWTQGETSYNSRWFPTLESPDQKMTQEISLTIPDAFVSLSNGLLTSSVPAGKGKRTDTWVQKKPASPYLTMIAVGKFEVIKDKWRDLEVSYYVEPAYGKYARKIFGDTPEMMEFFSKKLGYDYPWEKYSQIVVRDYVSGAMENTTATIMGENLQRTDRELIDENGEDIIAHELFHHWFGDLVTCESWSNLPLNESFATYSEYLWIEYKHQLADAERHRMNDLNTYLEEAKQKQVGLFRPYYESEEEMFDAHSYQKGGLILHYLRKLTGDEAFFEILKRYLHKHAWGNTEIPHLRQMVEEVTGLDYNWFFDQWFYLSGHPVLEVSHQWNDTTKTVKIQIEQIQDNINTTIFKLPLNVHIWTGNEKKVHRINPSESVNEFILPCKEKPTLVVVDPEHWVPGEKKEKKTNKEWLTQFNIENSYFARYEALKNLSGKAKTEEERDLVLKALNDQNSGIRLAGIQYYESFIENHKNAYKSALIQTATRDEKSEVRSAALDLLNKQFGTESWMIKINTDAATDKSYLVASTALRNLSESDPILAFEMAKRADADSSIMLVKAIAAVYAQNGSDAENAFFMKNTRRITGFDKYDMINLYGKFLLGRSDTVIKQGVVVLEEIARENPIWFIRLTAVNELNEIAQMYGSRARELKLQAANPRSTDPGIKQKLSQAEEMSALLQSLITDIKSKETDRNLIQIYKN